MKKIITAIAVAVLTLTSVESKAQAFDQSTRMLTLGIGGANMFHFPVGYTYYNTLYSPLTANLYLQGEFAVHKYVGVGFVVLMGGRPNNYGYYGGVYGVGGYYSGFRSEFNIGAGAIANFHFYQLIADKTGKNIHADKLDVYAGLSVGSGVAIHPGDLYYSATGIDALLFVGPQVGVRYFFKPNIGVNAELGYGKTFVNAGITFKLGGKK